jgi:hypothetical protein
MSIHDLCHPRPSVFEADRRATVLSLDTFLKGQVNGPAFFEENYFTNGMLLLVDRAFRHLSGGQAGSSIFQLSQAMGGGKTHSMIALGLLAQEPDLRNAVLGDKDPAPRLGPCRVVGFNGRNSDAPGGIWGSLAEQLGKANPFSEYVSPLLRAPGPEAWRQMLGHEPLIIFLDEIPPYLDAVIATPVGSSDLSRVTTTALANLFVAVADMANVCLVLSDLAGNNYRVGQANLENALLSAFKDISDEAQRHAVPITPVNPNGDELYHILRKRLFERVATEAEVKNVAEAYRDALKEARDMQLTTTVPEALYTRILESYPFHPDWRELVGKFKENEGFQQTRGVIRLMQMVVSNLWKSGTAKRLQLVHPYDVDLNDDEIASQIRVINPALSEAIAHDIAHGGDAEVEQIDKDNKNTDASDAARLVLVASLATTPGAINGLHEYQLIDCLQRPGRDLSGFKLNVLDKLAMRAWYLHQSADGRFFFKNQQNLAAKLRATANSLHTEIVERMLRERLQDYFAPSLRDCYQTVKVLAPLDEVRLEQDKTTLVIVRPSGQVQSLPISADWQAWWQQQPYKNRVVFLSGSRDTFQNVLDTARQMRALQSIEDELRSENIVATDPQWQALDALKDRVGLQFSSALKEAFDQVIYPSLETALRATNVVLAFADNHSGEATLRKTLDEAKKFTTQIDHETFRTKAEARLFGSAETKSVLWSDFKRAAAVNTLWPLHKPSALDELKAECLRRGLWREEGHYIRRGPFPPPTPEVSLRELSRDEETGVTYLKLDPLHDSKLVYETGDAEPTPASSPVPNPTRFEASGLRYRFLAFDPEQPERVSSIKDWQARPNLKYNLHDRGDHQDLELRVLPQHQGLVIGYTTDGSRPNGQTDARYDGPFRVAEGCRVVCAMAFSERYPEIRSEMLTVQIPVRGNTGPRLDLKLPARWKQTTRLDDTGAVWDFLARLAQQPEMRAYDISIALESDAGGQLLDFTGSLAEGYDAPGLKNVVDQLQLILPQASLRMTVGSLLFATGQELLDWLKVSQQAFDAAKVQQ